MMKKLKKIKRWFVKTKVQDLKNSSKLDAIKPDVSKDKIENADVIQGGAQKDTEDTTVDPQWPITH
ncbi:MAG: hypothetical protein QM610_00660 [Chitinophagaceae bacterium]